MCKIISSLETIVPQLVQVLFGFDGVDEFDAILHIIYLR
jgi:hypothetical protein